MISSNWRSHNIAQVLLKSYLGIEDNVCLQIFISENNIQKPKGSFT